MYLCLISKYLCQSFPCQVCVEDWVFFRVFTHNCSTFLRTNFILNLIIARFKTSKPPHSPPQTLAIFFEKLWDLELDKKNNLTPEMGFSDLSKNSVSIGPIHKALERKQASCSSARGQPALAGSVLWWVREHGTCSRTQSRTSLELQFLSPSGQSSSKSRCSESKAWIFISFFTCLFPGYVDVGWTAFRAF